MHKVSGYDKEESDDEAMVKNERERESSIDNDVSPQARKLERRVRKEEKQCQEYS